MATGAAWPLADHREGFGLVVAFSSAAVGFTLSVRRSTAAPLLLISSATVGERARSLDAGADVCVGDLEDPAIIEAQMMALLRLHHGSERSMLPQILPQSLGALELDLEGRRALVHNQPLTLSRREFDLLAHLVRNPNRALRRHELLGAVWGSRYVGESNTVDVHIAWLRQKLPDDAGIRLTTLRGVGYRLDVL